MLVTSFIGYDFSQAWNAASSPCSEQSVGQGVNDRWFAPLSVDSGPVAIDKMWNGDASSGLS